MGVWCLFVRTRRREMGVLMGSPVGGKVVVRTLVGGCEVKE